MRQFTVMIKPVSSLCNMNCKYCFYNDVASKRKIPSYGLMSHKTVKKMLLNIFNDLQANDRITFAFQGGEPLMAGLDFFRFFIHCVNEMRRDTYVEYTIQTNGILLNEEWCVFLKKNNFLVGLSLDGPEEFHDINRIDKNANGTYRKVINAKRLLDKHGIEYNILAVLTKEIAKEPEKFWIHIKEQKISYVQLIPCLDELEGEKNHSFVLTPECFAYFYIHLFELWKRDYDKNEIVSVKLFDDIINLLVYEKCTACGITGHCSPQLVVEADGSVYPCDFYVLDRYKIGNITEQSMLTLLSSKVAYKFIKRPRERMDICSTCKYKFICNGGCERMEKEVCGLKNSLFCGYKCFLDSKLNELCEVAKRVIEGCR